MMGFYNYMWGGYGGGVLIFAWIMHALVIVLLILAIVALWKYINKN